MSIFKDLFDKTGKELEKIEGVAPEEGVNEEAPAEPDLAPDVEFEALLDASPISARRYLQENQGTMSPEQYEALKAQLPEDQQSKLKGSDQSFVPASDGLMFEDDELDEEFGPDAAFQEMGPRDPGLDNLAASEPASEEEHAMLADTMVPALDFLYGKGLPATVEALSAGPQLYLTASEVAFEVVKKQHIDNPNIPSTIYFGQDGAMQQTIDAVFDIAQASEVPGSKDKDQYAASVVNLWRLAGEYIADSGDEESMAQAEELMINVAMAEEGGEVMESTGQANAAAVQRQQQKEMAQATNQHLSSLADPRQFNRI